MGIIHRHSYPYAHQSMGKVERGHWHIIDTTLALLNQSNITRTYWDYAVMVATFVYNHNSMAILNGISLVEKLFNT